MSTLTLTSFKDLNKLAAVSPEDQMIAEEQELESGFGHIANKVIEDSQREASSVMKHAAPARERGVVVKPLVAAFHESFAQSVEMPARRDDEDKIRARSQTAQTAWFEALGMSAEDLQAIENSAKSEATSGQLEGQRDIDPAYQERRSRLAKAFINSPEENANYPRELAKLAQTKRVQANAFASMRATDQSRVANEDLKVLFSTFNSACRAVVFTAGRAIASAQFHDNQYREDFHHEGKVYSIDKAADDLPAEGLYAEDNVFFGYNVDEIYASFEEWKSQICKFTMAMLALREDFRYTTQVRLTTPGEFDALEFAEMRSDKARTYTELEYRDFPVESVVEDELMKLKVSFAIEAKAAEFIGATDGHASSIDF